MFGEEVGEEVEAIFFGLEEFEVHLRYLFELVIMVEAQSRLG